MDACHPGIRDLRDLLWQICPIKILDWACFRRCNVWWGTNKGRIETKFEKFLQHELRQTDRFLLWCFVRSNVSTKPCSIPNPTILGGGKLATSKPISVLSNLFSLNFPSFFNNLSLLKRGLTFKCLTNVLTKLSTLTNFLSAVFWEKLMFWWKYTGIPQ